MKSTGEVLGIAHSFDEAIFKGLVASGSKITRKGGVLITVRDADKQEAIPLAQKFADLGFEIYATAKTANTLNKEMVGANTVRKMHEPSPNIIDLLESGKIDYVISTSDRGRTPQEDSVKMRRKAVERSITCLTSLDTANALVNCIKLGKDIHDIELVDVTTL